MTSLRHPYLDHPVHDPVRPPRRSGGRDREHDGRIPPGRRGRLPVLRDRCAHHVGRPAGRLPRHHPGPGDGRPGPDRRPAVERGAAGPGGGPRTAAAVRGTAGGIPRRPLERGHQGRAGAGPADRPDPPDGCLGPGVRRLVLGDPGGQGAPPRGPPARHLVRCARRPRPAAALVRHTGRAARRSGVRAGPGEPERGPGGRPALRPGRPTRADSRSMSGR